MSEVQGIPKAGETRADNRASTPPGASQAAGSALAGFSASAPSLSASTAFFVVLVVLAMLKAMLMRYYAVGGWHPVWTVVLEGAFIVLLLGAFDLIPPRRNCWVDLAAYTLLSILMFALTVYVSFYSQLFNPAMLELAGQLGTVTDVVQQLIQPTYALFLVDIPVLAVWAFFIQRAARAQKADRVGDSAGAASAALSAAPARRVPGRSRALAVVVVLAAALFAAQLVFVHRLPSWIDGVAIARARGLSVAQSAVFLPKQTSDDSAYMAAANEAEAPTTGTVTPVSSLATAPTTPGGKTQARIERIRGAEQGSRIATFPVGAYRGKNVIIVQVEALNTLLMQKKYEGQEITPNLNKLVGESWYFPNTYSETGIGNTADAEFVVSTSLYTPREQAAPVAYADRTIPALPRILRGLGYDTFTIHQNKVGYWNRKEMYAALGFNRYYDMDYFKGADPMGRMGSSDEELFKRSGKLIRGLEASGTPFYSQIITLSAHTPFEFTPESRRPLKTPSDLQNTLMGRYISAESYSDLAIGKFVDNLKASGAWDDSIVIIYGDHTAMLANRLVGSDARAAQALLGREYGFADRQRIPLLIHLPKQTTPVVREDVVGQVDIMPTVADLVGADLTQIPHMGRSVFVASNSLVPLRAYLPGGTFINDRVVFMPGLGFEDGSAVKVADGSPADPTDREKLDLQRTMALTEISDKWIMSLPRRQDAGSLADAWIPDRPAREAAKPFGAIQENTGHGK